MSTITTPSASPSIDPSASNGERLERQLFVALVGGVMLLTAWVARALLGVGESVTNITAAMGALILAAPLVKGAWKELSTGRTPPCHRRAGSRPGGHAPGRRPSPAAG